MLGQTMMASAAARKGLVVGGDCCPNTSDALKATISRTDQVDIPFPFPSRRCEFGVAGTARPFSESSNFQTFKLPNPIRLSDLEEIPVSRFIIDHTIR
jgi:hypothetical protein